jgi:hypothetical protein
MSEKRKRGAHGWYCSKRSRKAVKVSIARKLQRESS